MGSQHVIPQFIERLRDGDFRLFGGENTRSFIHVSDAIAATSLVAEADASEGQVVHIGTSEEIRISDLAQLIMSISGISGTLDIQPAPDGSVSRRCPDTHFLNGIMGFDPLISLHSGLSMTIPYYLGLLPKS